MQEVFEGSEELRKGSSRTDFFHNKKRRGSMESGTRGAMELDITKKLKLTHEINFVEYFGLDSNDILLSLAQLGQYEKCQKLIEQKKEELDFNFIDDSKRAEDRMGKTALYLAVMGRLNATSAAENEEYEKIIGLLKSNGAKSDILCAHDNRNETVIKLVNRTAKDETQKKLLLELLAGCSENLHSGIEQRFC